MDKKKLLFFRWRFTNQSAPFVLANKRLTEHGLEPFFDVVSTDADCDLGEMAELHRPDLIMFESGSPTLPFRRPKVTNLKACPHIPRIGLLESDPHSGCRSVFAADMERLGIETFFTRTTSMGDYFPDIAGRLFLWPWHLDDRVYSDRGLDKNIAVVLTGACSPPYPWRMKLFPLLTERWPTLRTVHGGYLRQQAAAMPWGEEYSRLLCAAFFSASCGGAWRVLVKKHLEIPGSGCCLIAEDMPVLRAAGFSDMENCILGDERDIPGKIEALLQEPERLREITRAGTDLVLARHRNAHRPQIRQWLDLRLGGVEKMEQDGPFGDVVPALGPSRATPHLENFCTDRALLREASRLLGRGRHREAAVLFQKVLEMAWHMSEANLGMAICELSLGRGVEARNRLRIPLKWSMKQYRCHAPDPAEWAWMIVTQLCRGRGKAARHMAGKYPHMRHEELRRARALVSALSGGAYAPEGEQKGRRPASIHASAFPGDAAWFAAVAGMLQLCGRPEEARAAEKLAEGGGHGL